MSSNGQRTPLPPVPPDTGGQAAVNRDAQSAAAAPSTRAKQIIAVGGGRGGVGKTLLSVNLAVYLAQLGKRVVVVDADPSGSNLHAMLGVGEPPLALPEQLISGQDHTVGTSVPGLNLLPSAYDTLSVGPKRPTRKSHWVRPIDQLDADYVVINLGSSILPATLDVFHESHVNVCVATPEPASIEATYRFLRALFARRLRRTLAREKYRWRVVERAIEALPPLPTPRTLIAEIARYDHAVANAAAATLQSLTPCLVVGKTRLKRDLDLGPAMVAVTERYLGVRLDYVGFVEQDDAVWLTARRRRPLLIDSPTSKSARNIERVARRLLALLAHSGRGSAVQPIDATELNAPMTLYKVLGVDRSATDEEIRRAYKLQRGIFREDSLPIASLVDPGLLREEQARISEAYDTLLDPARHRAYDMSVFPDDTPQQEERTQQRPGANEAELARLRADLRREITAETQFTGQLLQTARQASDMKIADVAAITKISPMYLRAIESEQFDVLPAPVFVRGFLQQIAKALGLDPTQVARTYLLRVHAAHPEPD